MANAPPVKIDRKSPVPAYQALLGALPFLGYGLMCIAMHYSNLFSRPPIWLNPSLVLLGLVLLGMGVGALAGFPPWAYAYLSWALILTWWLSDMSLYGDVRLDGRMWLLPLGILLLVLLIRRSLSPLRELLAGLWKDWTLLSLGIYAFLAFMGLMYDENHHPYLWIFIVISTLAVSVGAWFYFRQSAPMPRILALVTGTAVMILAGAINSATWDYRAYYNLPEGAYDISPLGVAFMALILALMVLTGYLSHRRQSA